jgi:hypothetical protein
MAFFIVAVVSPVRYELRVVAQKTAFFILIDVTNTKLT